MGTAILIVGTMGCALIFIALACLLLSVVAKAWEKATERIIIAAKQEERAQIANHYLATSWWFSEYPDAQHALKLATLEIVSGRQNSSQLREDFKKATGRVEGENGSK